MSKDNNLSLNPQDYLRISPKKSRIFNESEAEQARRLLRQELLYKQIHRGHIALAKAGPLMAGLSWSEYLLIRDNVQLLLSGVPANVCKGRTHSEHHKIWETIYEFLVGIR